MANRFSRSVLLVVGASLMFGTAACTDYVDRQETISYSAGNAVAHNQVAHMIDPWPAHAKNTRIDTVVSEWRERSDAMRRATTKRAKSRQVVQAQLKRKSTVSRTRAAALPLRGSGSSGALG
jgi:hypothetical protein